MTHLLLKPDNQPAGVALHVAIYQVGRSYGGPEFGGWFQETAELVTDPKLYKELGIFPSSHTNRADAGVAQLAMDAAVSKLNHGKPDWMHCANMYVALVHEDVLPTHIPALRARIANAA